MLVMIKVKLKKMVQTGEIEQKKKERERYGVRTKREKGELERQAKKAYLRAAAGFGQWLKIGYPILLCLPTYLYPIIPNFHRPTHPPKRRISFMDSP